MYFSVSFFLLISSSRGRIISTHFVQMLGSKREIFLFCFFSLFVSFNEI